MYGGGAARMYERRKTMKKLISLVLVLVLSLTAVSALASPVALDIFTIDGSKIKPVTEGVGFETQISQPSEDLANLLAGGTAVEYVYLDDNASEIPNPEENSQLNTYYIAPLLQYNIGEDVTEDPVKFEIPVTKFVADLLNEFIEKKELVVFFTFQDGDTIYAYELKDMSVVAKEDGTYAFAFSVPLAVVKAAGDKPLCLNFDIRA